MLAERQTFPSVEQRQDILTSDILRRATPAFLSSTTTPMLQHNASGKRQCWDRLPSHPKATRQGMRKMLEAQTEGMKSLTGPTTMSRAFPAVPCLIADASNAEQLETAPVQSSEKAGHEKEQETTEHTVEAAMGEIGFLSRSAMAEPRNERDEDPQELATGRMLRAALAITGANPIESRIDALQQVVGGMADQSFSLKRPLVTPFVSRFLDTEGIRFLHINSTHLWEDVEEFFSEPGSSHSRVFKASPARLFNFYLAIATGMLVSPQSASLQGLACSIHAAAVRLFSTIAQSENNANILSCMISMVLFSMHSPLGGSTWHLVGLAMKKAIAFGFHKASKQNAGISEYPETLIAEYHIFWDLYTLDRNISAIMDRPFGIEDDDITVPVSSSVY
ncbi:uncharacterized protein N7469_006356 [Penicillium citrinum]|uniref:Xylanolytic transcriptional activator regulatory domain-containing protein n=1 Tax=Penicillium citrinum TaxID=5077 RepID=A0A9W9NXT4_PENCI|nr:uncharacterized protein N7469_006356 [Penicillium citrinum]KAJ5231768.1 hypothetical protein N7469_006356 [Penicillium citrinum]